MAGAGRSVKGAGPDALPRRALELRRGRVLARSGIATAQARSVAISMGPSVERLVGGTSMPEAFRGAVIALGNFDGVHLGHQAVIACAVNMARARGVPTIVGTFDPHPVRHFRSDAAAFRLTTLEQRLQLLGRHGVDAMAVFAFDGTLANVTPEVFVDEWLRGVGGVVTGADFRSGRGRAGDPAMLAELGARRGIRCAAVTSVAADGAVVSSSRIRAALRAGDCTEAARLLTRSFTIGAVLRPGRRHDPALPLLDASIALGEYLRPRTGVYAVRGRLDDGRALGGSAYLASGEHDVLELFLVGLAARDLGRRVEVEMIAHLHDAAGHYDAPALRVRIARDRSAGCRAVAAWAGDR